VLRRYSFLLSLGAIKVEAGQRRHKAPGVARAINTLTVWGGGVCHLLHWN